MIPFKQVDVFTTKPYKGNPVAVVMNAHGLSTAQMQTIANWTNLSETTFVLPAQDARADYHVRIFTPVSELPFAGHPTIGTAFALLEAGIISAKNGRVVQECGAGLINLTVNRDVQEQYSISFELPEPIITPLTTTQVDDLENILGCILDRQLTPALIDVGARWIVAQTQDANAVLETCPNFSKLAIHDREKGITGICIYGFYPENPKTHIEVRSFAPACSVNEDPVCGSGNGSVAAFIRHYSKELMAYNSIQSTQGRILGRDGHVSLQIFKDKILVGGSAVTCIEGKIKI